MALNQLSRILMVWGTNMANEKIKLTPEHEAVRLIPLETLQDCLEEAQEAVDLITREIIRRQNKDVENIILGEN